MTIQLDVSIRNAMLDQIEVLIGASPILMVREGAAPANNTDPDTGGVLATVNLPADWMNPAAGGVKTKAGTWSDNAADATGTAGHFRIYKNDGVTCMLQGSYGTTGTDMIGNSVSFTAGQLFTVILFTLGAAND